MTGRFGRGERRARGLASAALAERSGEYESETMEVFEILEVDDEEEIEFQLKWALGEQSASTADDEPLV